MAFFLITYEGPTNEDEVTLMTAIESQGAIVDICYKTYLLKTNLNCYQLGEWIQNHRTMKECPLGSNDRLVIAQIEPLKQSTFAWHGTFRDQLNRLTYPDQPSPQIRQM